MSEILSGLRSGPGEFRLPPQNPERDVVSGRRPLHPELAIWGPDWQKQKAKEEVEQKEGEGEEGEGKKEGRK